MTLSLCDAQVTITGALPCGDASAITICPSPNTAADLSWPQLSYLSPTVLTVRSVKGPSVAMPDGSGGFIQLRTDGSDFNGVNSFTIDNAENARGLSVDTFYYVYLHIDGAGALAAEFSTTGWEWGVLGFPAKIGDGSRLCVGCVYVNDAAQWALSDTEVHVFSFHNQGDVTCRAAVSQTNLNEITETPMIGPFFSVVTPYALDLDLSITGFFIVSTAPSTLHVRATLDGTSIGVPSYETVNVVGHPGTIAYVQNPALAAGRHVIQAVARVDTAGQYCSNAQADMGARFRGQY